MELVHMILNESDIRSLSRIARVSIRGKEVVESLPAYRDLQKRVPNALAALGRTGIARYYSVAVVYAALRPGPCVSCLRYGGFLFLPTCERCCYDCLLQNPALWVVPVVMACKAFHLTRKQLKHLPTLHSIPGRYCLGRTISRQRRLHLISVKAAKECAIEVHGATHLPISSADTKPRPHIRNYDSVLKEWSMLKGIQEASIEPLGQRATPLSELQSCPTDEYCGMASIRWPSLLPNDILDKGIWCLGCKRTHQDNEKTRAYIIPGLTPGGAMVTLRLMEEMQRARSTEEFLEHVSRCNGALNLIPALTERVDNSS